MKEKRLTTIRIDQEVWKNLNSMKNIGENFNDVLVKLLLNNNIILNNTNNQK